MADAMDRSKLSARVAKHIAAQTPATNGEDDYDASGQINAEGCEACRKIKEVMKAHYGAKSDEE